MASGEEYWELFSSSYGPTKTAADALDLIVERSSSDLVGSASVSAKAIRWCTVASTAHAGTPSEPRRPASRRILDRRRCDEAVAPSRPLAYNAAHRARRGCARDPLRAARPPALSDVRLGGKHRAVKATVVSLAVECVRESTKPRFRGKAMKVRAIGYAGALLVVPVAWRLRGREHPYPRGARPARRPADPRRRRRQRHGMYHNAHVDDATTSRTGTPPGVVGALAQPRVKTAWEAGTFASAVGVATAAGWEIFEWIAHKLGARGMDLTYDDTMADLIETSAGAVLGGVVTLLRHPARLRRFPGRAGDPIVTPRS